MTDEAFRAPTAHRPPGRYGEGRRWSNRQSTIAAVVAVLAACVVVWLFWRTTPGAENDIEEKLIGFQPVSDSAVDVRFSVDRAPTTVVSCLLRARNLAGEEVGRAQVRVPAGEPAAVELIHTLKTTDLAVSAEVLGCQVVPPA